MHERIKLSVVSPRASFPKTTTFFAWGNYVIQQTGELVWNAKYLIFGVAFMLFLIYELAHFAKFLFHNWQGS